MTPPNIKYWPLLLATLITPMAALAIELPIAGSMGNQLQRDPVRLGEWPLSVEHT